MLIPIITLFMPYYNHVIMNGAATPLSPVLNVARILFIPLFLLIFYFTDAMHASYIRTGKVFASYAKAFIRGYKKAHPVLTSYAVTHISLFVISLPLLMFGDIGLLMFIILYFTAFAWVKTVFLSNME
jgi:hypothetical protein